VLCASSPAPPDLLATGLDALAFAGLEPVVYPSVHDPGTLRPYLAGDDRMRAIDLTSALTDPTIAGILLARGGSGSQRTLAALDWASFANVSPKVVVGYSDVTAILEALAVKLGWASVHGPNVVIGDEADPHYTLASLLRTLLTPERACQLAFPDALTVNPGSAVGRTLGGNLTLLTSSLATDTSLPASGGILLLEEESEADYRIDRMLTQLLRSGYLDGVAGIVTGTFTNCGPAEQIGAVLAERLAPLGVPMISWANIGHGGHSQTFPLGVAARLDADAHTLNFLEPPLVPAIP
jgi:muramoyltetrapeptide carboxypeptidase